MSRRETVLLLLAFLAGPLAASAHDARPVVVHLQEETEGVRVEWRVPRVNTLAAPPEVQVPEGCTARTPPSRTRMGDSLLFETLWDCESPLPGREITLTWPVFNPGLSTLFRAELSSGEVHSRLLSPGENAWTVPGNASRTGLATDFVVMGVRHILLGLDHLLFALCLMMIARTPRRIVLTVTGFTVAHALTLGLSAIGVVRLSNTLVETAIALSIVFAAAEIARGDRNTLTHRYPVAVAMAFGLLHGFGFASVLAETGLADGRLLTALFSFNIGVELGQLALIFLIGMQVMSARYLARESASRMRRLLRPGRLEPGAAYLIGVAATFWTLQRLLA